MRGEPRTTADRLRRARAARQRGRTFVRIAVRESRLMAARRSTDPMKAAARRSRSQRRVGQGAACTQCGESRPEALVARSRPKLCQECYQRKRGMKTTHASSPGRQSQLAAHRRGSREQTSRRSARRNTSGRQKRCRTRTALRCSPIAAALRGAADLIEELVVRWIRSCAEMLEKLDAWLRERHGKWWEGSPFEGWQPE